MSTRRFHRTAAEAFKGADYACSVQRFPADRADVIVIVGCGLALIAVGVMVYFGVLPL